MPTPPQMIVAASEDRISQRCRVLDHISAPKASFWVAWAAYSMPVLFLNPDPRTLLPKNISSTTSQDVSLPPHLFSPSPTRFPALTHSAPAIPATSPFSPPKP